MNVKVAILSRLKMSMIYIRIKYNGYTRKLRVLQMYQARMFYSELLYICTKCHPKIALDYTICLICSPMCLYEKFTRVADEFSYVIDCQLVRHNSIKRVSFQRIVRAVQNDQFTKLSWMLNKWDLNTQNIVKLFGQVSKQTINVTLALGGIEVKIIFLNIVLLLEKNIHIYCF